MARFYRTTGPQFLQGTIYTPPIELMKNVIAMKDLRTQGLIDNVATVDDSLAKVNAMNLQKERLNEIMTGYRDKVDELVQSIYENPENEFQYRRRLRSLRNDITTNMRSGELSNIAGNYAAYQNYLKSPSITEGLKTNPLEAQQLVNKSLELFAEELKTNPNATFSGRAYTSPVDRQKLIETMKDLKANKSQVIGDNRFWLINKEWMSEERLEDYALSLLMSSPQAQAYKQQRIFLGDESYLENPFIYYNEEGEELTEEELQSIIKHNRNVKDPKDLIQINRAPNPESGYYNFLNAAGGYSYYNQSREQNDVFEAKVKRGFKAQQNRLDRQAEAYQKSLDRDQRRNFFTKRQMGKLFVEVYGAKAALKAGLDIPTSSSLRNNNLTYSGTLHIINTPGYTPAQVKSAKARLSKARDFGMQKVRNAAGGSNVQIGGLTFNLPKIIDYITKHNLNGTELRTYLRELWDSKSDTAPVVLEDDLISAGGRSRGEIVSTTNQDKAVKKLWDYVSTYKKGTKTYFKDINKNEEVVLSPLNIQGVTAVHNSIINNPERWIVRDAKTGEIIDRQEPSENGYWFDSPASIHYRFDEDIKSNVKVFNFGSGMNPGVAATTKDGRELILTPEPGDYALKRQLIGIGFNFSKKGSQFKENYNHIVTSTFTSMLRTSQPNANGNYSLPLTWTLTAVDDEGNPTKDEAGNIITQDAIYSTTLVGSTANLKFVTIGDKVVNLERGNVIIRNDNGDVLRVFNNMADAVATLTPTK